ncbi:purine-nucleoside phosphorylase [Aurantibacillus circumpalustris]|uniref:purine-nucleoside phosphorylase n=1 Tax=Aurantibacillus circumpalustris TaxID=3036359 RepID=UPI00295B13A3|nr:purine-nucleoside phosphorylase [Aurantibacillus circumpalustris]
MLEQIEFTTKNILSKTNNFSPIVGIILGTGLGGLVKEITVEYTLPYEDIPNFPISTVEGHKGKLIFGELGGKKVMAMQGRFHFYEGYTMQEISFPVRVMKALGVKTLCVSNACGGMNPNFEVGELMIINDHINLFLSNPLIGKNEPSLGPRFPDMGETYKKTYVNLAKEIAKENNIKVSEGVYAGLTGPCFETPAEYRWLWRIGADVVGMSTVPEVIVAKHSGIDVFGISIVTDLGVEGSVQTVTHEEVMHIANLQEPKMTLIMKELVKRI